MTDLAREEIEMMSQPEPGKWPVYPFLPLKNPKERQPDGWPRYGVLLAWDKRPVVYLDTSLSELGVVHAIEEQEPMGAFAAVELLARIEPTHMGAIREKLSRHETATFTSFEALYAAGWIVD